MKKPATTLLRAIDPSTREFIDMVKTFRDKSPVGLCNLLLTADAFVEKGSRDADRSEMAGELCSMGSFCTFAVGLALAVLSSTEEQQEQFFALADEMPSVVDAVGDVLFRVVGVVDANFDVAVGAAQVLLG